MKTFLVVVLVGVVAAGALANWKIARTIRFSESGRARLGEKAAHVREGFAAAEIRLATLDEDVKALQAKLEQAKTARAVARTAMAAAGGLSPAAIRRPAAVASLVELESHMAKAREKSAEVPWHATTLAEERRRCLYIYQSLFQELGLTPAQIAAFADRATARLEHEWEFDALVQNRLVAFNDPLLVSQRKAVAARDEAALHELLGDAGYQKFGQYNRTTSARDVVTAFAGTAIQAGMFVPPARLEQFVHAIAASYVAAPQRTGYADGLYISSQLDPIDWSLADSRLRSLMTEAEWTLFKTQAPMSGRFAHQFQTAVWQAREAEGRSR